MTVAESCVTGVCLQEGLPFNYFETLLAATITMFQIYTLESWTNGIVRPAAQYVPFTAWLLFLPFVVLTVMIIINYFTGIIVENVSV